MRYEQQETHLVGAFIAYFTELNVYGWQQKQWTLDACMIGSIAVSWYGLGTWRELT